MATFINAYEKNRALVIEFRTSTIMDEATVQQVGKELDSVVGLTTHSLVVVDMSKLEMMTSSMLGRLVKFQKRCEGDNIDLRLCQLSKDIAKLFKVTRLEKVFTIKSTLAKASG